MPQVNEAVKPKLPPTDEKPQVQIVNEMLTNETATGYAKDTGRAKEPGKPEPVETVHEENKIEPAE